MTTTLTAAHLVVLPASAQTVSVANGTTRSSSGATAGVALNAPGAVLDNSGTVTTATSTEAVAVTSGATTATINNKPGGTLSGTGSSVAVITIQSASSTLTLNNDAGATITGVGKAGKFYGSASIANAGTINAAQGMDFIGVGGSIVNQAGATISASNAGNSAIYASSVANGLSVTNSGTISVAGRYGIEMVGTGNGAATIVNSGTISGGVLAMSLGGGNDTVTLNSGSTTNGALLGDGDDTLTIVAGAAIAGDLDGAGGTDTLALQGTSGTTNITTRVSNFESITKTGASSFRLGNLAATAATIDVSGGTLTLAGNPANWTGATTIASGATLAYEATTTATTTATITGAGNFTKLGNATLTLGSGARWTGLTTISAGTLSGTTETLIGSGIVDNATLAYVQTTSGSVGREISGTGLVTVGGLGTGATVSFDAAVTAAQGIRGETDGHIAIGSGGSVDTGGAYSAITLSGAGADLTNAGSLTTTSSAATATVRAAVATTITNSGLIKLAGDGGGRTIDGGTVLTVVNDTNGRIVNDSTNVDPEDPSGVFTSGQLYLTNRGAITATGNGVVVYRSDSFLGGTELAGTIANSGSITGGNAGILIRAIADVGNQGTITGVNYGINLNLEMQMGGVVNNGDAAHAGATIDATDTYGLGIYSAGALTVDNYGTIRGGWTGLQFSGGGTLTNRAGATVEGTNGSGVYSDYIALDVQNSGDIHGAGHALAYFAGGTLTNSGTITSTGGDGVRFENTAITLTSSGTISGALTGVHAVTGGILTNDAGGRIENTDAAGSLGAIHLDRSAGALTLTNAAGATIAGAAKAALFYDQADVDNSGTITSQQGIDFFDVQGSVVNRWGGVIESLNAANSSVFGYNLANGLSVANAGTIRSANVAIETNADSGSANIVNSGTLTGGRGTAIQLGNAADTVTLNDGAIVTGAIVLGGGSDGLTITTGAGNAPVGIALTGALDGGAGTGDTLTFAGDAGIIALDGDLAGFETITKSGANTLRLTGGALGSTTITANGGTIAFLNTSGSNRIDVDGATLSAGSAGAFGSGGLHLVDGTLHYAATGSYANALFLDTAGGTATLAADSGITATLSGPVTRSAGAAAQGVTIGGAGTILLTGTGNGWRGTTTIAAGATLRGASAAISGGSIANSGTLVFDQAADAGFTIPVGGSGAVTKLGAGTLSLGGVGSWTGRTTVSAGTLAGTTTSLSTASPITVNATLAYVQSGGGTVSNTIDGTGVVRVSGLSSGEVVSFGGTVTVAGGIVGGTDGRIAIASGGSVSTTANAAILLGGGGASLTNGGTIGSTTTEAVRITAAGGSVLNTAGHRIASSGSVGVFALAADADVDNSGTVTGATNSYGVQYYQGGTVTNRAGGTITGGVAIGGYAGMTIINAGTLTATNAGPYNGAISIRGGADTVTLAAGSTTTGFVEMWDGDDALTLTGGAGGAAMTTVTGYVSGGDGADTLTFDGSGTGTLAGNVVGFEAIGKSGAGVWTIRGASDISATVGITGGTLALDSTQGLTNAFLLDGGTLRAVTADALGTGVIHAIAGTIAFGQTGSYANAIALEATGSAGRVTLAADGGTMATLGGQISRAAGAIAQDVTIGGGHVLLSHTGNSWTGRTTIVAGATLAGSGTTISGGSIVDEGTLVLAEVGDGTLSIPISGSGALTKDGAGALTLSGAGSWTGVTTIAGGSLIGSTASISGGSIVNDAALTFDQGVDGTSNQAISGNGSLTKAGTGNLTLAGAGSWTGAVTILDGTLTGSSASIAGSSILNAAALVYDQATDGTVTQAITGGGTLTKAGAGALTLDGGSTSTGDTRVTGGALRLGSADLLSDTAAVTVIGATLDMQAYDDTIGSLSLAGTLAGTGRLTASTYTLDDATIGAHLGAGTLVQASGTSVLAGYSLSEVVEVTGGTLRLGASDVLSDTATLIVRAGATLDLQNFSDAVGAFTILGSLTGTGTLTANAYHLGGGSSDLALGAGRMYVDGGINQLNATAAATTVAIGDATLRLGADDRLNDHADVSVAATGTLDLQGYSDSVRSLSVSGVVTGTGTLTAETYALQNATVAADLGVGSLRQQGGESTLTGTSAAERVSIAAGTLTLGGNDRLASGAALSVAGGATLDLGAYRQTTSGRVDNAGTIRSGTLALAGGTLITRAGASTAIVSSTGTSSIATAAGGTIGTVTVTGGHAIVDNYGALIAIGATGGNVDLRLYAGSTTGAVTLGSGDDTLALYTDVAAATLVTSGAAPLRGVGSYAAAQVGAIDLGRGVNSLDLRGNGSGTLASGAAGITTLTKRDKGNWSIADLIATTVNAGTGTVAGGTLTLTGTGTIDTIRVDGATLTLASTTAAGAATLRMIDPTVNFAATGTYANAIDLAVATPDLATDPSIFANLSGGAIALSGAITESVPGQNVRFTGAGSTTLSGSNGWSGTTTIDTGTTLIGTTGSIGGSAIVDSGTLTYDQATDGTVGQRISGTGSLTKSGAGTVTLSAVNGFTGGARIGGGGLRLTNAAALASAARVTLSGAGATLIADAGTQILVHDLSGDAGTDIRIASGGLSVVNGSDLTIAGILSGAGTGGLDKGGAGRLTLSGANTLTTGVSVSAGTLALSGDGSLSSASGISLTARGAAFDISAVTPATATIQGLTGVDGSAVTIGNRTLAIGSGIFAGSISGGGGLIKVGSGTLTLTGANTYAGPTQVAGGTLALTTSGVLPVATDLTVGGAGTLALGSNDLTVGTLVSAGAVDGAATLVAMSVTADGANYTLQGGTVSAGLGAGILRVERGSTLLSGRSDAATVTIASGTLRLGKADRLSDAAAITVARGATLDVQEYGDTIATLALAGTLAGTGTLTAGDYTLDGATVAAQLGAGTMVQRSGLSTLAGTSAAATIIVASGTLALDAKDRLSDAAVLTIGSGAVFDLKGFDETVGMVAIGGALSGSGMLTAGRYSLAGATIRANLGAGTLVQAEGTSTLIGSVAARRVAVLGGALTLGADERLADGAIVSLDTAGTLDASDRTESIAALIDGPGGGGTVATGRRGRLVLGGSGDDFTYSGRFDGTGDVDKVGGGTFAYAPVLAATTARLNALGGTIQLAGQTAGAMRVAGGALTGAGGIGGGLTLESGTLSPGTAAQPLGVFQASNLTITGGSLMVDLAGAIGGYASDLIRVAGAATLGGGQVTVRSIATSAGDRVARFYTILQAGRLTGSFANGGRLAAVSNDPASQWRLRYDLVPDSVLVEVRKQVDFTALLPADRTGNQQAVAAALGGAGFTASDLYADALNRIASGTSAERRATFDSLSGEAIGSVSTGSATAAMQFAGFLQRRIASHGGFGATGAAIGHADGRRPNALERLWSAGSTNGIASGIDDSAGLAVWLVGYGADARIAGRGGAVSVQQFDTGQAMGAERRSGSLTFGLAGALNQTESKARALLSHSEGRLYQFGAYAGYDDGTSYASVTAGYFDGDVRSQRSVYVNGTHFGRATGDARTHGYMLGGSVGRRIAFGHGFALTPEIAGGLTSVHRNAFTESGAGVLSLAVEGERRDLYQAGGQIRLSHRGIGGRGWIEPFVTTGIRHNGGGRDTESAMRFTGAPVGAGRFSVRGAALPANVGLLGGGLEARVERWAKIGVSVERSLSRIQAEGRINMNLRIDF
ncbi:MAG: autotransporter-associated beta strand repeat-containing protein [Sphingomonas phyllosphaerae]